MGWYEQDPKYELIWTRSKGRPGKYIKGCQEISIGSNAQLWPDMYRNWGEECMKISMIHEKNVRNSSLPQKPLDVFQHISYFSSGRLGGFVNLIFSILFQTFEILAWGIFFCGRERSDDEVSKMQSSDKFQYIMCSHGTPAPPDILLMMPNFDGRILKLLQI